MENDAKGSLVAISDYLPSSICLHTFSEKLPPEQVCVPLKIPKTMTGMPFFFVLVREGAREREPSLVLISLP